MILQYRGYNNNWCYEYANCITFANVGLKQTIELATSQAPEPLSGEILKRIEEKIIEETSCRSEIQYNIGKTAFEDLTNVCVVMLDNKITHVIIHGAYILNDNGGTVQRIN